MKKTISVIAGLIISANILTGCNAQIIDTTYKYDKAIIALPNGETVVVSVKSWRDYDGEQLQIVSKDGTVYLTSSFNCILIKENRGEQV